MRKLIVAAAVAASMAFAPAHAGVIDFANDADTNGERGVASGSSVNIDGESLQLIGYLGQGNPYLDASTSGGPGGLGLCETLGIVNGVPDQCIPSNDDSVTAGQGVGIMFDRVLDVLALSFNDFAHNEINAANDGLVDFYGNNQLFVGQYLFSDLIALAAGGDAIFTDTNFIGFVFVDLGFYVNAVTVSDIPIPGALPLLLSGLAGLGFASRKKKKATA